MKQHPPLISTLLSQNIKALLFLFFFCDAQLLKEALLLFKFFFPPLNFFERREISQWSHSRGLFVWLNEKNEETLTDEKQAGY